MMKRQRYSLINLLILALIIVAGQFVLPNPSRANGISIDAGLTPAEDRLMLRSQVRFMKRDNHPVNSSMEMKAQMYPVILAYGLRSDLTIMARQLFVRREMTMMNNSNTVSGAGDLMLLAKYRLYRINQPGYTIGIAPTLGLEMPVGKDEFSSNSYDLRIGSFFSGRVNSWGMDLDLRYVWNGFALADNNEIDPGDEIAVETALARQYSLSDDAAIALAPVVETSYIKTNADDLNGTKVENTGETVLLLSPGLKLTWNSLILESLIQFPVWQSQKGLQTERKPTLLLGFRLMN